MPEVIFAGAPSSCLRIPKPAAIWITAFLLPCMSNISAAVSPYCGLTFAASAGLWAHMTMAYIGMQLLMRRPEVAGFISMSLPTNTYDFAFLAPCPASGLVTYATEDQIIPAEDVDRIVERIRTQKGTFITTHPIEGADHFYTNHLDQAMDVVDDYLDNCLDERYCPPREPRLLEE